MARSNLEELRDRSRLGHDGRVRTRPGGRRRTAAPPARVHPCRVSAAWARRTPAHRDATPASPRCAFRSRTGSRPRRARRVAAIPAAAGRRRRTRRAAGRPPPRTAHAARSSAGSGCRDAGMDRPGGTPPGADAGGTGAGRTACARRYAATARASPVRPYTIAAAAPERPRRSRPRPGRERRNPRGRPRRPSACWATRRARRPASRGSPPGIDPGIHPGVRPSAAASPNGALVIAETVVRQHDMDLLDMRLRRCGAQVDEARRQRRYPQSEDDEEDTDHAIPLTAVLARPLVAGPEPLC